MISSDLAHTHLKNGPYGYSPDAEPFDEAISKWGKTLNSQFLIKEATSYSTNAKSCGFTGLVLLDGILKHKD